MGLFVVNLSLLFLFFIICVKSSPEDYYTSSSAVQKLMKMEQHLLAAFNEYVGILETRIEKIKKYLDDYEESIVAGMRKPDEPITNKIKVYDNKEDLDELSIKVSSHPLMTYRLIRRFVIELHDLEREIGNRNEKKLLSTMEKLRKGIRFPTSNDVQGSIEGLIRVQDAYDLNITEFTSGNFQGLVTNSNLTAKDCYQVGIYALEAEVYARSVEWLHRAYILTIKDDRSILTETVLKDLQKAIKEHDETRLKDPKNIYVYTHPIDSLENLLKQYSQNGFRLQRVSENQVYVLYQEQENLQDLYNFAALCSGKELQTESMRKSLGCFLKKDPIVPLYLEKIEMLHTNPDIIQIYDILNDNTMKHIIKKATPRMTRARVQGTTLEEKYSATRTSTSSWIKESSDVLLKWIPHRIQRITGLNVISPFAAEDLQVANYGIAGHYNPHLDILFEDFTPGPEERFMGDRIATFMFYLSEVKRGGGTAFPRLGVIAKPIKGSALFWFNMRSDGSSDQLSLHGGCPVLYGTKHVANKWIRSNAQMNTRKCELKKP